jgi:hypothetical protein
MTLQLKEFHERNTHTAILIILISCLGIGLAVAISAMYGPTISTTPFSSEKVSVTTPVKASVPTSATDLGRVSGLVMSSDGLPVDGASVVVYKHMGLINSVDKNAGYTYTVISEPDGSYSFDTLPSGVYKFTVMHPDGSMQMIDNYAVWPSSSSSYFFEE